MIEEIIDELIELKIRFELSGDNLIFHGHVSNIPVNLLNRVKIHKRDLVKYLSQNSITIGYEKIAPPTGLTLRRLMNRADEVMRPSLRINVNSANVFTQNTNTN